MTPRAHGFLFLVALATGLTPSPRVQAQTTVALEFDSLHFRSIGPATMSGRIADVAVYEANPAIYYVGTAHGGVWKTTSGGAMFTPLFQNEGLISIGDVAVSQTNPDLIWVGTGESNNRQTTSWGGGIYKSSDGGETFEHMGLDESRHINRILIDPRDDDVVLVAATGPLFGAGGDRGVFKTTNGGESWTRVLAVDEDTGANALVRAKTEPNTLYASTYQRRRNACCMNGGGPGSGIWKSTDSGDTWTRLSGSGLPDGPLGRIDVDVFSGDASTVYALIEGPRAGRGGARGGGAGGAAGGRGGAAAGGRAGGAGAGAAGADAEAGEAAGGEDEEAEEDEPPQTVMGLYRSVDGGLTWEKRGDTNPRPMYFSQVKIDPQDADRVYMGGVGLHLTIDGGESFVTDAARVTHDDVHAIWINPANPEHVLIGNDGGLAVSWDRSKTWTFIPNLPVGLFYHVNYDMERPYNICGGMQDNYNWCGPSASRQSTGIMNYDWFQVRGGDGFVAMPDLRNPRIVYAESQGGNMVRRDIVTGESKSIRPSSSNVTNFEEGDSYRWHWDTPFIRSPNDPGVLLAAAQRVFRSTDRGDSWTAISPDLTTDTDRNEIVTMGVVNSEITISRNDGISNWSTLVSLAESSRQAGLYYTGGDDGVVSVSRDGGGSWQDVTANLTGAPDKGWVSEVVPSSFASSRVYVAVDNHLHNDYEPYVWVSEDYGATFRSIISGLQGENVRTLTEDHRNPDVLYVGTETGIFVSLNRGASWRRLRANLPSVRVDEITLHERDNAMLVATHGRALFVLDHLEPIQEYTATMTADADAQLFTIPTALQWKSKDDRNEEFWGHQFFVGENPPTEAVIQYQVKDDVDELSLRISNAAGRIVRELTAPASRRQPGIRTLCWDMRLEPIASAQAGRGGGGGGGGGRGGGGGAEIQGIPTPTPSAGYLPLDPCDLNEDGDGGGGRGGFGGGGNAAPIIAPGTYDVALVADGDVVDSKPLTIVMDPAVQLAGAERIAYDNITIDLHELQRRGTAIAGALNTLHAQVTAASDSLNGQNDASETVKAVFEAFEEAWDELRVKFGVPMAAGGGGRGGFGRGRGGGGNPANVLARTGALKSTILSFWEAPSAALIGQYYDVKPALEGAIADAEAMLLRAEALSEMLDGEGITMEVPALGN
jgi:hypothetical protein